MRTIFSLFLLLLFSFTAYAATVSTPEDDDYAIIFTYHRFGETKYPSTNIRLDQFKYQLDYLKEHNYNVLPLYKIVKMIQTGEKIPPKTVAICMDDAYRTVYTNAYPMLKERGFPFTVFVNTMPIIHKSKRYVTWDMLREMAQHGAYYASHTYSHAYLTQKKSENKEQWEKRVRMEVDKADEKMRKELGNSVNEHPKMIAYPFGEYSLQLEELLKSMDYVGISQLSGPFGSNISLMRVPRFPMSETYATKKGFLLKLNTVPMPVASVTPEETMLGKFNPPQLRIKFKRALKGVVCYKSSGDKIDMKWINDKEVVIQSQTRLKLPRDHYTCTAKAEGNKWYWYSHLWVFRQR